MEGLVLNLFFHGLIAFAPNEPLADRPSMVTAYMLKDDHHFPALAFEMVNTSSCPEKRLGGLSCVKDKRLFPPWCVCELKDGVDLSVEPASLTVDHLFKAKPEEVGPSSPSGAADFSWLVRMENAEPRATHIAEWDSIDEYVYARLNFGFLSARVCHLDQEDVGAKGSRRFNIRPSGFVEKKGGTVGHRQALAEYARFELRFPFGPVRLTLTHRETEEEIELNLGCGVIRGCPDVLVANIALPNSDDDDDDDDIGQHFLAYYRLARVSTAQLPSRFPVPLRLNELSVGDNQLYSCLNDPFRRRVAVANPIRRRAQVSRNTKEDEESVKEILDLFDEAARRGIESRIICPMAMFEP